MRRDEAKRIIVWTFRALFVVIFSILLRIHSLGIVLRNNKADADDSNVLMMSVVTKLNYVHVESGKTRGGLDFRLYKAVGNDEESVSIQTWTQLLATDGTSLSGSFTHVLQVRLCVCELDEECDLAVAHTLLFHRMLRSEHSFWKPRESQVRALQKTLSLSWSMHRI